MPTEQPIPEHPDASGVPATTEPVVFAPISPEITIPVQQTERIVSIDVLRGVALLGILVMNIQSFAMIDDAYFIPIASPLDFTGINQLVWIVSRIFADQKFMSIFSMLFGAGVIIMTSRAEEKGRSAIGFHYRRNFILLIIGMLHAYLLWNGDILYTYAMCSFFVFLFRKMKPHWLILMSIVFLAVPVLLSLESPWIPEIPDQESIQKELSIYRGDWLGQVGFRLFFVILFQTIIFAFYLFWRVSAMMFLGMALYKMGVFSAKRSNKSYLAMLILGAGIGIPMIAYDISQAQAVSWDESYYISIVSQFNYVASIFVAFAWIGLVMLFCKSRFFTATKRALAAVGQTALTNYLLHTIICTAIFYGGYGFGLYGKLERWEQSIVVIAIWIVQLVCSSLWLKCFKYGPFEWMWRSLTYWKLQPLKR